MCGRFVIADTAADLVAMFEVEHKGENLPEPSWNVKPTEQIPIVLESAKQRSRCHAGGCGSGYHFLPERAAGFRGLRFSALTIQENCSSFSMKVCRTSAVVGSSSST